MNCRRCQEELIAYVEGISDEPAVLDIESHLADCPTCRDVLDDVRQLAACLAHDGQIEQDVPLLDRVERMRLEVDLEIEVTGRCAARARRSLARQPDPLPLLDAPGNGDPDGVGVRHHVAICRRPGGPKPQRLGAAGEGFLKADLDSGVMILAGHTGRSGVEIRTAATGAKASCARTAPTARRPGPAPGRPPVKVRVANRSALPQMLFTLDPADAGWIDAAGRFVAYREGPLRITARAGAVTTAVETTVTARGRAMDFTLVGEGVASSEGEWEITVEPLQDGHWNIYGEVEDLAGNISPLISIEGSTVVSDERRGGSGVLDRTLRPVHFLGMLPLLFLVAGAALAAHSRRAAAAVPTSAEKLSTQSMAG